MDANSVRNM